MGNFRQDFSFATQSPSLELKVGNYGMFCLPYGRPTEIGGRCTNTQSSADHTTSNNFTTVAQFFYLSTPLPLLQHLQCDSTTTPLSTTFNQTARSSSNIMWSFLYPMQDFLEDACAIVYESLDEFIFEHRDYHYRIFVWLYDQFVYILLPLVLIYFCLVV